MFVADTVLANVGIGEAKGTAEAGEEGFEEITNGHDVDGEGHKLAGGDDIEVDRLKPLCYPWFAVRWG